MAPKGNKKSTKEQLLPAAKNSTPQQNNNNNPPNWPPLKPLIPASDLYLETLLDDQILIIRNLLTSTLSKTYVSFLSSLPLVTTPSRPKKYEAVRVNDRFQVHDPIFAEMLWSSTALKRLVSEEGGDAGADGGAGAGLWGGEVLGLNPNIRIYRYGPGQFFDKHYDDSVPLSIPQTTTTNNATIRAKTTWTLLIYLTTCTGGETVFYPETPTKTKSSPQPEPLIVGLEAGMALLHRHGERCLLHEGREVTGGEKWVIRSDLVVRR